MVLRDTKDDGNGNNGQGIVVSAHFLLPDGRNSPVTHDDVTNNTDTGNDGSGIMLVSDQTATISSNDVSKNGLVASPGNGIEIDMAPGLSATTSDLLKLTTSTGNGQNGGAVWSADQL